MHDRRPRDEEEENPDTAPTSVGVVLRLLAHHAELSNRFYGCACTTAQWSEIELGRDLAYHVAADSNRGRRKWFGPTNDDMRPYPLPDTINPPARY